MNIKAIACGIGLTKLVVQKCFNWKRIVMSIRTAVVPSVSIQVGKNAHLILESDVSIRRNCELNVRRDALLKVGKGSFLNSGCIITAHKSITLGEHVELGPNVLIFDHDHKFKENGYRAKEFECDEIVIGNNVWIGANTVILRGTEIGDNCVIGAGCVVKGKYESGSLVIQKRETTIKKQI